MRHVSVIRSWEVFCFPGHQEWESPRRLTCGAHTRGADLLNGDRTILGRGGQGWLAYGSPYAGSSRCYVNESCSVTAVVILKQAPACQIRRMRAAEAFRAVYAGLTVNNWDSRFVDRICDLAGELIREVPVYELACTPDRHAAELLYSELQKGYRDAEQRPED